MTNDALAAGNHVLRLAAGAGGVGAVLASPDAQAPWTHYECSVRFRLGHKPPAVPKGSGGLFDVCLRGDDHHLRWLVQAAYMKGGSWYFNLFGLRHRGEVVPLENVRLQRGPFRSQFPIDEDWHTLAVSALPGWIEIRWDDLPVFRAEDPRLALRTFEVLFRDPTSLFRYLDVDDVTVRRIEVAGAETRTKRVVAD